jgi:hypothetical protein
MIRDNIHSLYPEDQFAQRVARGGTVHLPRRRPTREGRFDFWPTLFAMIVVGLVVGYGLVMGN